MINLNQCRINFSLEEQVRKAEIIQASKSVESNYSFASANGDGERFKEMFLIPRLPRNTQCQVQNSDLKDLLLEDLKNAVFTCKFDESTTQQVNKQYDRFIQYWSKKHKCIKISH